MPPEKDVLSVCRKFENGFGSPFCNFIESILPPLLLFGMAYQVCAFHGADFALTFFKVIQLFIVLE